MRRLLLWWSAGSRAPASAAAPHGRSSCGSQAPERRLSVEVFRLSGSGARGVFPDQRLNLPCRKVAQMVRRLLTMRET